MNKLLFLILFIFSFSFISLSQQLYSFDSFSAQIQNSTLTVKDKEGNDVFEMNFSNPHDYATDLDGDSINEYIVIDSTNMQNLPSYTIYIFNTIDEFSLVDSIASGITEPYNMLSDEEGGEIIITGNKDFEEFYDGKSDLFIPINCWKYDSGQVYLINDDIYDLYINENDDIISYLDSFFESGESNCNSISQVKSAIASVYANYVNAGEVTLASQFIKKYYPCDDVDAFLQKINVLLNEEKSDENGME
ncbi:MAG TPA: hypothetical protein VLB50_01280 [Ignavibacteriaceae bacterium]|nr:hypothetical protein [Ignavibacteriaceae bacterium]